MIKPNKRFTNPSPTSQVAGIFPMSVQHQHPQQAHSHNAHNMSPHRLFPVIALVAVSCQLQGASAAGLRGPSMAEQQEQSLLKVGRQAYTYFYPMMVMDETRVQNLNSTNHVRVNQFANAAEFMAAGDRAIVRPNVDTLYSTAWLDCTHEPMVMSVPDTKDRYYEMQMLDGWTNTFAAPGKRTTGTDARNFLVLGPENRDEHVLCNHDKALQVDFRSKSDFAKGDEFRTPTDLTCIDAPTSTVFVLGRTQTNGVSDYDAVHAVQAGYKITPLSKWLDGDDDDASVTAVWKKAPDAADATNAAGDLAATPTPPGVIASLDAQHFFSRAAALLSSTNPPSAADAPLIQPFAALGITRGSEFNFTSLAKPVQRALSRAVKLGNSKVQGLPAARAKAQKPGWAVPNTKIGSYGTDYELREDIAVLGLFANIAKDAIYINLNSLPALATETVNETESGTGTVSSSSKREPLTADKIYTLTFPKGALPPVGAFWSVTLYDTAGYLIPNSFGRYALHSWDHLIPDANGGSTTITISAKPPAGSNSSSSSSTGTSNWLPAPADGKPTTEFQLTARFYWPGDEIANGEWEMPSLQVIESVDEVVPTQSATEPRPTPEQTIDTQILLSEKDQVSGVKAIQQDSAVISAAPSDDASSASSAAVVVVAVGVACVAAVVAMFAFRNNARSEKSKNKNSKRQPMLSLSSSDADQQYAVLETPQTIPVTAGPADSNSVVLTEKYMEL